MYDATVKEQIAPDSAPCCVRLCPESRDWLLEGDSHFDPHSRRSKPLIMKALAYCTPVDSKGIWSPPSAHCVNRNRYIPRGLIRVCNQQAADLGISFQALANDAIISFLYQADEALEGWDTGLKERIDAAKVGSWAPQTSLKDSLVVSDMIQHPRKYIQAEDCPLTQNQRDMLMEFAHAELHRWRYEATHAMMCQQAQSNSSGSGLVLDVLNEVVRRHKSR